MTWKGKILLKLMKCFTSECHICFLGGNSWGFLITQHCKLLIWVKVSGQQWSIISNFIKASFKSAIPHVAVKLFTCCFCNLWTWATFLTKQQTRKQYLGSCYADRSMKKKKLCGHREYVPYIILRKRFRDFFCSKCSDSLPVLQLCLYGLQLWVKNILYSVLFLLNILSFFSTYSTTDGPAHSFYILVFLHNFYYIHIYSS